MACFSPNPKYNLTTSASLGVNVSRALSITLIKNPTNSGGTTISTATTLQAMDYLDFSAAASGYTIDELLVGGSSGAQAYEVRIDGTKIYYTQNSKTGYKDFTDGETVTGQTSSTAVALKGSSAVVSGEVNRGSGEILFLENRNPINRSTTQIEDIKVIIEF